MDGVADECIRRKTAHDIDGDKSRAADNCNGNRGFGAAGKLPCPAMYEVKYCERYYEYKRMIVPRAREIKR